MPSTQLRNADTHEEVATAVYGSVAVVKKREKDAVEPRVSTIKTKPKKPKHLKRRIDAARKEGNVEELKRLEGCLNRANKIKALNNRNWEMLVKRACADKWNKKNLMNLLQVVNIPKVNFLPLWESRLIGRLF